MTPHARNLIALWGFYIAMILAVGYVGYWLLT